VSDWTLQPGKTADWTDPPGPDVSYGESATLRAFGEMMRPSFRDRLRQRRRGGRPRYRVVSLEAIERAHGELRAESVKRPSQADVARRLGEPLDNVERALGDRPGFWKKLACR
jgi:hypothetical protein